MNYSTTEIVDKDIWEQLIASFPESNFLQSYNWGSFHFALGKRVLRIVVSDGTRYVAIVSGVIEVAKRGTYLAIAGGPLLDWTNASLVGYVFAELKERAKAEGCQFIRFRPQEVDSAELRQLVSANGAVEAPMHLTADLTLQLNLTLGEEELLGQMRKNTRSTIRKAVRDGYTVEQSSELSDMEQFCKLQEELAARQQFVPFSREFLTEQFKAFSPDGQVMLFHSYTPEHVSLASAFVLFYNQEAVYHYGVSTLENHSQPGSYVCQWYAIQEAKRRGCLRYNFWGIAPKNEAEHRFAGVSLFKRGFGGEEVAYLPAHDIPLSAVYGATKLFELARKKLRRL